MKIEVLNPNAPKVYTDPEKVRMLSDADQMVAIINLAKTGQVVQGNEVLTMEAMLREAGYPADMNGQFSAEEMAYLEHLKDQMEDKELKDAANELARMMKDQICDRALDAVITPDHLAAVIGHAPTTAQTAAVRLATSLALDRFGL